MAKRREEMDSAMGPDEEPGEARPAKADEALGLGGAEPVEGPPEVRPEDIPPGEGSPGEKIRRRASH